MFSNNVLSTLLNSVCYEYLDCPLPQHTHAKKLYEQSTLLFSLCKYIQVKCLKKSVSSLSLTVIIANTYLRQPCANSVFSLWYGKKPGNLHVCKPGGLLKQSEFRILKRSQSQSFLLCHSVDFVSTARKI